MENNCGISEIFDRSQSLVSFIIIINDERSSHSASIFFKNKGSNAFLYSISFAHFVRSFHYIPKDIELFFSKINQTPATIHLVSLIRETVILENIIYFYISKLYYRSARKLLSKFSFCFVEEFCILLVQQVYLR